MAKKVISLALAVCMTMLLMLATAGCGAGSSGSKVKVGFVFIGPIKDGGWTQAHYNGMQYLKDKLKVEVMYREQVPEGPDSKKAINELINAGCNVIFTTSFGYMDPTAEAAKENPNVKFFHCSGYKTAKNMSNYFGRMYEARYLSGIVAGMKTKTDKIGYIGAFAYPEVISGINAFALGVQSVNPDAVVKVRWIDTWGDPAKEKAAGIALLDDGCDVITQHSDSTGPQIAAEERNAFAIGYDLDNRAAAPKAYMTAPVWNWGPYYIQQVKAIMNGTWKSGVYHEGIKEGILDLAPLSSAAPAGAKAKVEAARKKIINGALEVFKGPIIGQSGKIAVPEGKTLTYDEIMGSGMNWFAKNVEGKIEQSK